MGRRRGGVWGGGGGKGVGREDKTSIKGCCMCNTLDHLLTFSPLFPPPSLPPSLPPHTLFIFPCTDYEKVITHYIQLYRYNDALQVLTEKALEVLKQGSDAVGGEGGKEERKGRKGETEGPSEAWGR